jgi:anti-anti-sigma regulatory factor
MDCDQVRISFTVEPDVCVLRLAGALGVTQAEELRLAAQELCGCGKDVTVDWSGATQIDAAIAQVLLALRAGLREGKRSLVAGAKAPPAIESWLTAAGLVAFLSNPGAV